MLISWQATGWKTVPAVSMVTCMPEFFMACESGKAAASISSRVICAVVSCSVLRNDWQVAVGPMPKIGKWDQVKQFVTIAIPRAVASVFGKIGIGRKQPVHRVGSTGEKP